MYATPTAALKVKRVAQGPPSPPLEPRPAPCRTAPRRLPLTPPSFHPLSAHLTASPAPPHRRDDPQPGRVSRSGCNPQHRFTTQGHPPTSDRNHRVKTRGVSAGRSQPGPAHRPQTPRNPPPGTPSLTPLKPKAGGGGGGEAVREVPPASPSAALPAALTHPPYWFRGRSAGRSPGCSTARTWRRSGPAAREKRAQPGGAAGGEAETRQRRGGRRRVGSLSGKSRPEPSGIFTKLREKERAGGHGRAGAAARRGSRRQSERRKGKKEPGAAAARMRSEAGERERTAKRESLGVCGGAHAR